MNQLSAYELGWVVGFLEGEGTFHAHHHRRGSGGYVNIAAGQVQQQPLLYLQSLLGGRIYVQRERKQHRQCFVWRVTGKAALAVLPMIHPHMSSKRQAEIQNAMAVYASRPLLTPKQRAAISAKHLQLYRGGQDSRQLAMEN